MGLASPNADGAGVAPTDVARAAALLRRAWFAGEIFTGVYLSNQ